MQVFPRETLDYIASKYRSYANKDKICMTVREARTVIDYASGPVPAPTDLGAVDTTRPNITGGGRTRPSKQSVDEIFAGLEERADAADEWAKLFDELAIRCQAEPDAEMMIKAIKQYTPEDVVCEEMHISSATYFRYREAVLSRAAVLAVQNGLMIY